MTIASRPHIPFLWWVFLRLGSTSSCGGLVFQEVSGVDDSSLSVSSRIAFYVYWNDTRVVRLKPGDRSMNLGQKNLDQYFLPDFYVYNLLEFKQSEFADPLKSIFITPDDKMW